MLRLRVRHPKCGSIHHPMVCRQSTRPILTYTSTTKHTCTWVTFIKQRTSDVQVLKSQCFFGMAPLYSLATIVARIALWVLMFAPGKAELQKEIQERAEYFSTHKRTLVDCADKLNARGNDALLQARRSAKLESLRKKRWIQHRYVQLP